jgi:hypothetical protein
MDPKLARGLTRQGIRQDHVEQEKIESGMSAALKPFLEKYAYRGRLKKDEAKVFLQRNIAIKHDPHDFLFCETFTNPAIKALSPNFDMALVGGSLSSGRWFDQGRAEPIRSYTLICDRIRRTSYEYRFHLLAILVREHAISRYIENADASYRSLSAALWPGLLFLELVSRCDRPAFVDPFMLPSRKSVFLGLRVMEEFDDGTQHTYCKTFSKEMPPLRDLTPDAPRRGMRAYVNTFVDEDRLSRTQI